MAANAPYYQQRGQFTNGTNTQFASDVDDYDLSTSLAPRHVSVYGELPSPDTQPNTLEENHNLVELLEAATTAAGQAAGAMNAENSSLLRTSQTRGKRKRQSSPPTGDAEYNQESEITSRKRARIDIPTDPQLQAPDADAQNILGNGGSMQPSDEMLLNDPRAAGVHSAAALFKPSSKETVRKYTRPPMSKLFMSLQLTPENFLHLQGQAKAYMLDPAHPDRQSCVGNRGKGDTDMVKLRLFNCVRDFLDNGAGDRFFGENVEKPAEKDTLEAARALGEEKEAVEARLVWPRDGNKIISIVTPLLRRMVTNERQRMYAFKTRKGSAKKKGATEEASDVHDQSSENASGPNSHTLQVAFHDNHSIAHNQLSTPSSSIEIQHPSDLNATDHPPFSQPPFSIPTIGNNQGIDVASVEELALPRQQDRRCDLREILILLAKGNLKLKQQEKIIGPYSLASLTWAQFHQVVHSQIWLALATYPELCNESYDLLNERGIGQGLQRMGPEALQGLAVAATEIQKHANAANGTSSDLAMDPVHAPALNQQASVPTSGKATTSLMTPNLSETDKRQSVQHDEGSETATTHAVTPGLGAGTAPNFTHESPVDTISSPTAFSSLANLLQEGPPQSPTANSLSIPARAVLSPSTRTESQSTSLKYVIKAVLTSGLKEIKNQVDWQNAKDDVGYSVWADGRLTVVVEFV